MKKFVLAVALATTFVFSTTSNAQTIAGLVAASGGEFDNDFQDYDILLTALQTAGLVDALDNPDDRLTVFAPNDAAFVRLARDFGYVGSNEGEAWNFLVETLTEVGGGDPIPVLTDVLLYHVAPKRLSLLQVIFAQQIETLQGATSKPFFIIFRDNEPDLRNPKLFYPFNLRATNGIIHTINRVLIPVDLP